MTESTQTSGETTRAVQLLHTVLSAGVATLGLVCVMVLWRRGSPFLPPENAVTPWIRYGSLLASLAVLGVAMTVLRPRVPARSRDQSSDDYWAAVAPRTAALVLWVVCHGAAIIALTGYLLTGWLPTLAGALLSAAALFAYRASTLTTAA